MAVQDSLVNMVTGMGVAGRDKFTATQYGVTEMTAEQCNVAYRGDWIARKCVDIPAFDATREWRAWQADKSDITGIEALEKLLGVQRKVMNVIKRGRLYGGGALVLGVDQGDSSEPLIVERVGKGALKFVQAVSRFELTAGPIDWNMESPWYGEPEYYTRSSSIAGGAASSVKFHPSRVVRFVGKELLDYSMMNGNVWGDSVLQAVSDAIMQAGTVASGIGQLIQECKIDVIRIPELTENLINAEYERRLTARFAGANSIKSMFSMLLLDKEEEWQRQTQTFTAMPDILKMYLLIACGAVDIPATRFLGQSATGLNATGDNDTRNYYDMVATEQKVDIAPRLDRLDQIMVRSALGSYPDGLFYNWNSLWQLSDAEKADIANKKATVMTADVNAGLLSPLVLQKARENQLIEDGTYPGLEQIIEEFGDDITERDASSDQNPDDPNADPNTAPDPNAADDGQQGQAGAPSRTQNGDNGAKTRKRVRTIDRMAERIRTPLKDATPRTLYLRRDVLNGADIIKWAKSQGFDTTLDASEMHVTIAYSKQPLDWLKVGAAPDYIGNDDGTLTVKKGGPRMMEQFNGGAIVLVFASSPLAWRHCDVINAGGSSDFDDYNPHITITYKPPNGLDLNKVQPYQGVIKLGPEIFETTNSDRDRDYENR